MGLLCLALSGCAGLDWPRFGSGETEAAAVPAPPEAKSEIALLTEEIIALRAEIGRLTLAMAEPAARPVGAPAPLPGAPAEAVRSLKTATHEAKAPEPAKEPAKSEAAKTVRDYFAIHLASYRAATDAAEGWRTLNGKFAPTLKGLEPRLQKVEIPAKGTYVRLKAGPFSTWGAAEAACGQLRAKAWLCTVLDFSGDPLSGA